MLTEPITVTLLVIDALETLNISYFIGGSFASAIHGVARATRDADLIAEVRQVHAEPLVRLLQATFYIQAEDIRDALMHRSSFNLVHLDTSFKVDIFVMKERPFDRIQFARRIRAPITGASTRAVYFATSEDTILAKLEWYRMGNEVSDRQWNDVIGVLKLQAAIDTGYLRQWAPPLGLTDLLERALAEAGL